MKLAITDTVTYALHKLDVQHDPVRLHRRVRQPAQTEKLMALEEYKNHTTATKYAPLIIKLGFIWIPLAVFSNDILHQ